MITRTRTLLVALALATLATVLTAAPAHAVEVKQQTHLVAQFKSGHTGWVKIALERDYLGRARAHLGVWCQNASGTKVQCGAIAFGPRTGLLTAEVWIEPSGSVPGAWVPRIYRELRYTNTDPPLTLNQYTVWLCMGEDQDQYRAVITDVLIEDAFGEWSGPKTRTHPTWLGDFCTA